jgi:hypothetical protein
MPTRIIIPTRSPSVSQWTASMASSWPMAPAITSTTAPARAAGVRCAMSVAKTNSTTKKTARAKTIT